MMEPPPWIDPAEIEEARQRNSASRFARLWQGVWSSGVGDALDPDDVRRAVRLHGPVLGPERGMVYFVGLDLSTKRDHTAAVLLGSDSVSQTVRVCQVLSWSPASGGGTVDLAAVRDAVGRMARQFGAPVYFDPHQAALLTLELQRAGVVTIEMPFVAGNLSLMATSLLQAFRERRIELFDDKRLIDDLSRLSIEERPFGHKLTAPADKTAGHADRAFALAIALPAAIDALRTGGIIDMMEQPVIELEGGIMGTPIDAAPWRSHPVHPGAPGSSPGALPGFGGSLFGPRF